MPPNPPTRRSNRVQIKNDYIQPNMKLSSEIMTLVVEKYMEIALEDKECKIIPLLTACHLTRDAGIKPLYSSVNITSGQQFNNFFDNSPLNCFKHMKFVRMSNVRHQSKIIKQVLGRLDRRVAKAIKNGDFAAPANVTVGSGDFKNIANLEIAVEELELSTLYLGKFASVLDPKVLRSSDFFGIVDQLPPSGSRPRLEHLSITSSFDKSWSCFDYTGRRVEALNAPLKFFDINLESVATKFKYADLEASALSLKQGIAQMAKLDSLQCINLYLSALPHSFCYGPSLTIEEGDEEWKSKINLQRCDDGEECVVFRNSRELQIAAAFAKCRANPPADDEEE